MAGMTKRRRTAMIVVGAIGAACLILGCVSLSVFDGLIHSQVSQRIPLSTKGETYKQWQNATIPIYFQVWAFDIVNHGEILKGEKPAVIQRGPYTYRETRVKHDIEFSDENGTVAYKEKRKFVFDRSLSVGSENDTISTVNMAVATLMNILRYEPSWVKTGVEGLINYMEDSLFVELSVHDMLWGYEDKLLKAIADRAHEFNISIPIPTKVGLLMGQNDSDSGDYVIHSGENGLDNFGELISWNGQKKLSFWTSDFANAIKGSLGVLFPPFLKKDKELFIFSPDLTRSMGLEYQKEVRAHGIPLYKFVVPPITFANLSVNPDNAGFCTPAGHCLPSGLLNVSNSRSGAPVVISNPHFLFCEQDVIDSVKGLAPDRETHGSHLNIEPLTGMSMVVAKRLQINVHLDKIDGFAETYQLNPLVLPVMWLNESAAITTSEAQHFKREVLNVVTITEGVKYGLIALGGFLLLVAASIPIVSMCGRDSSTSRVSIQGSNSARNGYRRHRDDGSQSANQTFTQSSDIETSNEG